MAAAAGVHSHHPCNAGQLQRQPTGRSLFDSGSCAVLDEDAGVGLGSFGSREVDMVAGWGKCRDVEENSKDAYRAE
eukprot:scaffold3917_cov24-Tisochrysis_lutea.AAC.1